MILVSLKSNRIISLSFLLCFKLNSVTKQLFGLANTSILGNFSDLIEPALNKRSKQPIKSS